MTPLPANEPSPSSTERAGIGSFFLSHYALGYLVLGALATYLYLSDHRAHFLGALPFLLLLACPLMHVFMHHGHGGHGGQGRQGRQGAHGASAQPDDRGGPK